MKQWRPRVWPLSPSLALDYAGVDSRPLSKLDRLPGIIGLRLTGWCVGFAARGELALVDLTHRPASGFVLADLPEASARLVGFAGRAVVARSASPDPGGVVLQPFTAGRGEPVNRSLLVPRECILGRVVATVDFKAREWSTWARAEKRLTAALAAGRPGQSLTIEGSSFGELRDRLAAAARVYDSIRQPADLMDRSFPKRLDRAARREYQDSVRWARSKGLRLADLAAIGGGR